MSSERDKTRIKGQNTCGLHSSLLCCFHFTDAKKSDHILFTLAGQ